MILPVKGTLLSFYDVLRIKDTNYPGGVLWNRKLEDIQFETCQIKRLISIRERRNVLVKNGRNISHHQNFMEIY